MESRQQQLIAARRILGSQSFAAMDPARRQEILSTMLERGMNAEDLSTVINEFNAEQQLRESQELAEAKRVNEFIAKYIDEMSRQPDKNTHQRGAYKKAAANIRKFPYPITSGAQARKEIAGIGESIATKIDEILATGTLGVLESRTMEEKIKDHVMKLFEGIYGVKSKTAEKWYDMGYRTLADLADFYPRMTPAQKLGYQYYNDFQMKIPRSEIDFVNQYFHELFDPMGIKFVIAGSYRRGLKMSSDIDVLVQNDPEQKPLLMSDIINPLIASGFIIGNLTTKGTKVYRGIVRVPTSDPNVSMPARRLDVRLVDADVWPFALLYFTGSKNFNIHMRNRALSMGLSLSEYELTEANDLGGVKTKRPAKTERDIFDILKVKWLEPEERTDNVMLEFTDYIGSPQAVELSAAQPSYFTPAPTPLTGKWYQQGADFYVYITDNMPMTPVVAGFDLDHTLVQPESGTFPKGPADNVIMPKRLQVLKDLVSKGYMIVIFTNQSSRSEKEKQTKIARVSHAINLLQDNGIYNVPFILMMSTAKDEYRKPETGMWKFLATMIANINMQNSFYVGDAGGRPSDHSDSDLMFAKNIGIPFYLPEQLFP